MCVFEKKNTKTKNQKQNTTEIQTVKSRRKNRTNPEREREYLTSLPGTPALHIKALKHSLLQGVRMTLAVCSLVRVASMDFNFYIISCALISS